MCVCVYIYDLYMYKKSGAGLCSANAGISHISIIITFCGEKEIHPAPTIQL